MGEQILASLNNSSGEPGTGAQVHYLFTGPDGTSSYDEYSGGLAITFAETEYWFRCYVFFPAEYAFGGVESAYKVLYGHMDAGSFYWNFPYAGDNGRVYMSGTATSHWLSGCGDSWLESSGRQGFDRWIPIEIHVKNDTDGTDGILQAWVDETLVLDNQSCDFGVGTEFQILQIGLNGYATGAANTCMGIRYDDMAFATTAYTGFVDDGNGNNRIGPLSSSPTAPSNLTATAGGQ